MPRAIDITCDVDDAGRLPKAHASRIGSYLKLYAGSEVRIRISKPTRSTRANRYYWGAVLPAIQSAMAEAGMAASCEALHIHFKRRYLPPRVLEVLGETHVLPGSSAELDSTAFYDYVESIRMDEDVITLGAVIPDPDPEYKSYKLSDEP